MKKQNTIFMTAWNPEGLVKLSEYLSSQKIESELDWYLGYRTLNVSAKDYAKALTYGSVYVMDNDLGAWWISPDSDRLSNVNEVADISRKYIGTKKNLSNSEIEVLEELGCLLNRKMLDEISHSDGDRSL